MADSPSEVWNMITDLQSKSKGAAESELHALQVNKQTKKQTTGQQGKGFAIIESQSFLYV